MYEFTPIGHIHTDLPAKFGVPRQSGLVPELRAQVVLEPPYNSPAAVRGLEAFSHLWLVWVFSHNSGWSPTVRPPRLGGNERMGVFATRSPFRPNPVGISAVSLLQIDLTPNGPILTVGGADLVDGTPILDIKPYVPADAIASTRNGFLDRHPQDLLEVVIPPELAAQIPAAKLPALRGLLAQDPRPAYHAGPTRLAAHGTQAAPAAAPHSYALSFAGREVDFTVEHQRLTVVGVRRANPPIPS